MCRWHSVTPYTRCRHNTFINLAHWSFFLLIQNVSNHLQINYLRHFLKYQYSRAISLMTWAHLSIPLLPMEPFMAPSVCDHWTKFLWSVTCVYLGTCVPSAQWWYKLRHMILLFLCYTHATHATYALIVVVVKLLVKTYKRGKIRSFWYSPDLP